MRSFTFAAVTVAVADISDTSLTCFVIDTVIVPCSTTCAIPKVRRFEGGLFQAFIESQTHRSPPPKESGRTRSRESSSEGVTNNNATVGTIANLQ
eukprot:6478595-Amphidinium_carterae.1